VPDKRIELISAAYSGRSIIASGQECVNLFAEINQQDPQAPAQVTYYPTPGTVLYVDPNFARTVRGTYRTSIGTAYAVIGPNLYFVLNNQTVVFIGNVADRLSQVYMIDNGLVMVLVDGVNGYVIDLATNAFAQITDPNFYGADFVVLLDTFFVFNRPATNQFYISISNADFTLLSTVGAFDPLDIAAKSGFNDPIVGIASVHRELWLIGNLTAEVWIGTGAADFYFQQQQGAYINHGCAAPYSIVTMDVLVFFIMQDQQGNGIVVQGQGYDVTEISTPRIVEEFKGYITLEDAIGFTFQIGDHAFYALVFPAASKGWLYEVKTKQWSEWNWCDENGNLLRPRANCCMFAYGVTVVGDWENGKLLELTLEAYTDEGSPIIRIRTFPHSTNNNNRISYKNFQADMEVGTITDEEAEPMVSLSWSDDKGKTYGNPVEQSLGMTGDYLAVPSWNRLGMARDRIFKLQWSADCVTALNGGFMTPVSARS
jgi:hypothetical protein